MNEPENQLEAFGMTSGCPARMPYAVPPGLKSCLLAPGLAVLAACGQRTEPAARSAPPPKAGTSAPATTSGIPHVVADFALQQVSVREAIQQNAHPERLSVQVPPTPFELNAYRAHPESYINIIEPGRAMAPSADAGVPELTIIGGDHRLVPSLSTAPLSVRVPPQAPATFTSLDMGAFENGLTSISVQAGDDGVATAHFTATAGTNAEVRILIASPMASGQGAIVVAVTAAAPSSSAAPASSKE